ncbi:MAG: ABC transporter substrate-binding protein [Pseudomonadota bacterium]
MPNESVGQYGGDWNSATVGGGSLTMLVRYQGYEPLVRWNEDFTGVVPNVAESVEANEDATEYTVKLREGMKWSDGEPFTADDIMFWYEDVFGNPDLPTDSGQAFMMVGGEPGKVEKIDDTTLKFIFPAPHGLFPQQLAWGSNDITTRFPRHYLEQFHIKYNPDELEALAAEQGIDGWVALFLKMSGAASNEEYFKSSEIPVLHPWAFEIAPGESTTQAVAVRNPYYWKVDTEGNQLPYIDRIVYSLVQDTEVLLLKTMQGEIDLMDQYIATPTNKSVLYENQERGGYRFYGLNPVEVNEMVIQLNLNHPDAAKRELFQNKDFRIALSHGFDRQALNEAVFVGQGEIGQAAVYPGTSLYNERLAKQFTEYDPDKANAMLDEILPEKDSEGYRLLPDGERLTIIFEIDQARPTFIDMFEIILPQWQQLGIDAQIRTMDRSLWEERVRSGINFDATAHKFGGGQGQALFLDPRYFVPVNENSMFAKGWQLHYNNPDAAEAVEPPAPVKEAQALYDEIVKTADVEKQGELMAQMLELAADNFYHIGTIFPVLSYGVVSSDFRNVPAEMPMAWGYPNPAPTNPEQYWQVQ